MLLSLLPSSICDPYYFYCHCHHQCHYYQYDYYNTLQVVLARAEALAKAQFARSRDAHDCALMYVALKKKQLLLVRMLQQAFINRLLM